MMTCEDGAAALTDLLFAELDDATGARLNEHLLVCEGCQTVERRLLALREGVRGAAAPPDAVLANRVRLALANAAPVRSAIWRRPVPAYAAVAAGVLCAALAVALTHPRPGPVEQARDVAVEAPGVSLAGGGVAFTLAEASGTGVRGTREPATNRSSTQRSRSPRGDTL